MNALDGRLCFALPLDSAVSALMCGLLVLLLLLLLLLLFASDGGLASCFRCVTGECVCFCCLTNRCVFSRDCAVLDVARDGPC